MLRGLLLCGGQSIRMQSDKGLLKLNGKTWAEIAYNKLKELDIPVEISINKMQIPNYSNIFKNINFIIDDDTMELYGPLLGIASAHISYSNDDLLIVATDMPLLKLSTFQQLLENYSSHTHQIYIFEALHQQQPLCGIYTKEALQNLRTMQTNNYSLKAYLAKMSTLYLKATEIQALEFQNFNTPEELVKLKSI